MALIEIKGLTKTYEGGFQALKSVDLSIKAGEILALLGPNGAGKTTLIGAVCGLVRPSGGSVIVDGHDIIKDYRHTRAIIGLVPQELANEAFETVWNTVSFSRGLFGKSPDPAHIESLLEQLSLMDKRDNMVMTLSGGMKRRVMIAKALSHEPRILFLDEPTAGVDVELRRSMWRLVERLRQNGVTIILTTHYIEEAEAIADRIAVINKGEIALVEEKDALMRKLGRKRLGLELHEPLDVVPPALAPFDVTLSEDKRRLIYVYDDKAERTGVARLIKALAAEDVRYRDLQTTQSSLEDIFVQLVGADS